MTEFDNKPTYEELLLQNAILEEKCNGLIKKNEDLKTRINTLQENFAYEICEYFNSCNSIKQTAEHCGYEGIVDCGEDLVYFQQCSDYIQCANDYKEYYLLVYGEEEEIDEFS